MSDAAPASPRFKKAMEQDGDYVYALRPLPRAPVRAVHVMQLKVPVPVQTPATPVMEGLLANVYQ